MEGTPGGLGYAYQTGLMLDSGKLSLKRAIKLAGDPHMWREEGRGSGAVVVRARFDAAQKKNHPEKKTHGKNKILRVKIKKNMVNKKKEKKKKKTQPGVAGSAANRRI